MATMHTVARLDVRKIVIIPHSFACVSCGYTMTTRLIRCPGCMCDYSHLVAPTSTEAIEKKEKHSEIVTHGTVSLGDGPGRFNASFDHNGVASQDKIVRFVAAFGHRDTISSGPGRTPSNVIVSYLPEVIGSGVSNFWTGERQCSGVCIILPASPVWGHLFPVMDDWIRGKDSGTARSCVRCSNRVPFGQPFCSNCYAEQGSDWRTFVV